MKFITRCIVEDGSNQRRNVSFVVVLIDVSFALRLFLPYYTTDHCGLYAVLSVISVVSYLCLGT